MKVKDRQWKDVAMLILGLWLVVSPFILQYADYTGVAAVNSYILGIGVMVFAAIALARPKMWEETVNLILGAWLFIAPFVLGFQTETAPMVNHIVLGLLIAGDALWAMYPRIGHRAT